MSTAGSDTITSNILTCQDPSLLYTPNEYKLYSSDDGTTFTPISDDQYISVGDAMEDDMTIAMATPVADHEVYLGVRTILD